MKNKTAFFVLLMGVSVLPACARQSTPSMMNTSRPQLVSETSMLQVPLKDATPAYLNKLANHYERYGANSMRLSLAYDPSSKDYGAVKAFGDLSKIKSNLETMGVRGISAETMKVSGSEPTLMVSYDAVTAAAPAGCRNMPGMEDGLTTEQIGDYRFGCSTDDLVAKQIYRPSDLAGNDGYDAADGRRAANGVEYYRRVDQTEAEAPLERFDRSNISQ